MENKYKVDLPELLSIIRDRERSRIGMPSSIKFDNDNQIISIVEQDGTECCMEYYNKWKIIPDSIWNDFVIYDIVSCRRIAIIYFTENSKKRFNLIFNMFGYDTISNNVHQFDTLSEALKYVGKVMSDISQ